MTGSAPARRNRVAGIALTAWSVFPAAGVVALAGNFVFWWRAAREPCDPTGGICNEGPMYGLLLAVFGLLGIPVLVGVAVVAVLLGVRLARSRMLHVWPVVAIAVLVIAGSVSMALAQVHADYVSNWLAVPFAAMAVVAAPVLCAQRNRPDPHPRSDSLPSPRGL